VLVGYLGSRSVHLSVAADDINLVPPIVTSAGILIPVGGTAIDPNWAGGTGGTGIRPVLFDGASSYESFQAQIKKTMSHGVQGQLSYALGNCKDNSSAPVTGDTYANSIAVPLLLSQSYRHGPCDFDIRHVMTATLIWNVPGPKAGPMSYALGGWELGTIVTVTSGSPFTPTIGGGGDPLGTGFNGDFSMDFASILKGCNPIHGGVNYLNLNCFTTATAPSMDFYTANCNQTVAYPTCLNLVGNAGRNSLYGPGLATVDFSVFKNFRVAKISEAFNVQFRAEFFNILNHTNFQAPNFLTDGNNNSVDQLNAGILGSTTTTARQIQFGLKLIW
jgi:hypothetical protein